MLFQLNIDQFVEGQHGTAQTHVTILWAHWLSALVSGAFSRARWSGGKVELGILPLGGGLAFFAFLLYTVEGVLVDPARLHTELLCAAIFLILLGVCRAVRRPVSFPYAGSQSARASDRSWRRVIF